MKTKTYQSLQSIPGGVVSVTRRLQFFTFTGNTNLQGDRNDSKSKSLKYSLSVTLFLWGQLRLLKSMSLSRLHEKS